MQSDRSKTLQTISNCDHNHMFPERKKGREEKEEGKDKNRRKRSGEKKYERIMIILGQF